MQDWLTHRTNATPNELALINADTDTHWSYSGLNAAVDETAGRLVSLGVETGDQVGMLMSTQLLSVCLVHAAQRLGIQLVPLNDRLTASELSDQLAKLDLTMLVCGAATEPDAVEVAEDIPVASVDEPQWDGVRSFQDVEPAAVEPIEWSRDEPQLIVFTSGSTGSPKPVVLTMGNLLSSAIASGFRLGIDPTDRWLATLSLYHVGGLAPIFRSTLYGTAIVLRSEFEPGRAADDIDRYDVTMVSLVPTMLRQMLDRRGTLADSLRVVLLGGAPTPASLIERCQNYSIPVHPTYGMTETASQVATARPQTAFEQPETVGTPLMWTDVTICDEDSEPLEDGEMGEIMVAGPTVTPGYYGSTTDAFTDYGLRTGDVGYQTEDGELVVCNRVDDRIHSGGETIDPGEIIDVLTAHESITAAAVVGLEDEEWGERVAALVVPATEQVTKATVEQHCENQLAGFKIPKTIAFAAELPRTASGSVDRERVTQTLQEAMNAENARSSEPAVPDGRAAITRIEEPQLTAADKEAVEVDDSETDEEAAEPAGDDGADVAETEEETGAETDSKRGAPKDSEETAADERADTEQTE